MDEKHWKIRQADMLTALHCQAGADIGVKNLVHKRRKSATARSATAAQ